MFRSFCSFLLLLPPFIFIELFLCMHDIHPYLTRNWWAFTHTFSFDFFHLLEEKKNITCKEHIDILMVRSTQVKLILGWTLHCYYLGKNRRVERRWSTARIWTVDIQWSSEISWSFRKRSFRRTWFDILSWWIEVGRQLTSKKSLDIE